MAGVQEKKGYPKVTQLSGRGIAGLENDPPMYHFDVEPEQADELMTDPTAFLEKMGLTQKHGIAPEGRVSVTWTRGNRWDHEKQSWVRISNTETLGKTIRGCCYVSDDSVICHVH